MSVTTDIRDTSKATIVEEKAMDSVLMPAHEIAVRPECPNPEASGEPLARHHPPRSMVLPSVKTKIRRN